MVSNETPTVVRRRAGSGNVPFVQRSENEVFPTSESPSIATFIIVIMIPL
ncbi:MAG: hypothetical protein BAJATHORv1_10643 [Candidatus Thorarchaeota archaeon]|nr:MAG: hypothetical protein BAJATHORv1_10643 [Candidatus Thorarchaeota archaeon]